MAEQIVIAELQINTKSLQDSSAKLIQQIAQLRAEQKELQKETSNLQNATDGQSRSFVDNDAKLKQLNTEYQNNKKVLAENVSGQKGLIEMLEKEVVSTSEAEKSNKKLSLIRSQITTETQAGKDAITEINKKIDENNKFIDDNSDKLKKQKNNVGNYEVISKSLNETLSKQGGIYSTVRTEIQGFKSTASTAINTVKDVHSSLVGAATGIVGFGNSSKLAAVQTATLSTAQDAAGVAAKRMAVGEEVATVAGGGLVTVLGALLIPITAIIVTGLVLYNLFKNFDPVVNPVKDAMAALGAVIEVLKSSVFALVTGTKSLSDVFSSFGSEAGKAADEALKLAQAQREVVKGNRALELSTAKAQAEITKLMMQSKNRTLSEEERIGLLDKAVKLEEASVDKQLKLNNQKIANARLVLAEGKMISEEDMIQLAKGNSTYAQSIKYKYSLDQSYIDDLRKLQVERYGIQEASSRVLEKANNLSDKLAENQAKKQEKAVEDTKKAQEDAEKAKDKAIENNKKRQDKTIQLMNEELSLFTAKENLKTKTVEQSIAFEESISKKRIDILNKEYEYGKISKAKYDEEILKNDVETKKNQAEIAVKNLEDEATLYKLQNQSKIGDAKTLTEFLVNEESSRIEAIYKRERELNQKRFDENLISEREFQIKSLELQNGFEDQKKSLKAQFDQQSRAELELQRNLDFDTKGIQLDEQNASQFQKDTERLAFETAEKLRIVNEIEQADKDQKLADLEAEKAEKESNGEFDLQSFSEYLERKSKIETTVSSKTQQAITNITRASAIAQSKIESAKLNAKLQGYSAVAGGIAQIAGKETAVGKAAAIAQTTISTYQAATAAYAAGSSIGGPAGVVMGPLMAGVAIAAGLANVASIVGVQGADGMASSLSGVASLTTGMQAIGDATDKNIPKAEKGALFKIGGNRHSAGGTKFQGSDGTAFEAEEGELIGVMNRNASRAFMDFNNSYPSGSSSTQPNVFASGGFVTQNIGGSSFEIDVDLLAHKIGANVAQANASLPPPIVYTAISDINHGQREYAQVVNGANH